MKTILKFAAVAICTIILLTGCAETRDPGEGGIGFHPRDWATPGSDNNHAVALEQEGLPNSAQDCARCHGADYGFGTDDDCFACHAEGGPQGHPIDFDLRIPEPFHGDVVINDQGTDACVACHAWVPEGET